MNLRPYQTKVIEDFQREVATGKKRIILVAPTGSGKTVIGSAIIKSRIEQRRGVLVIAHRREIIQQTSDKLHANGVPHGIIMAGEQDRPLEFVQVASIQTLWSRAMQRESMELPKADLLVIDEAHHCPANTYSKIRAATAPSGRTSTTRKSLAPGRRGAATRNRSRQRPKCDRG